MIARDEARCIQRSLASARPWVDEMVVLDTGSRDDTVARAQAAGARVVRFDWTDDFAAARNHALAQTDADWRLVLDADEWIEAGGAGVRLAIGPVLPGAGAFVGQVEVASDFDDGGRVQRTSSWISRLLPRGVTYAGRVHEQPVHQFPVRRLLVRIGHDGYRQAQMQAKRGRNRRLLEAMLHERSGRADVQAYVLYQLGKEAESEDDYSRAVACYERAWSSMPVGLRRPAWMHDLVVRLLFSLKRSGRHADAVKIADQELSCWTQSPDFHFALGDLLLDWAAEEPVRAAELLPMAESAWLRCLELGEAAHLEGAVRGRGSFLAAHNLSLLYEGTGRADQARAYRRLARPN